MAKEVPYFKFFTGEWANGDITCESYEAQGLFINLCSIYWTKLGNLTEKYARKKFKCDHVIDELIESNIIKVDGENIIISFLDEQISECKHISNRNSRAGLESAKKRALNNKSTPVEQPLNNRLTTLQPLREDKIREEKIREDNTIKFISSFPDYESLVKKDEVFIRNLFQELTGKWTFLELNDLHRDLGQKLINYKFYCDKYKIKLKDNKHIKNSFKKFALSHWNKNTTQIMNLK